MSKDFSKSYEEILEERAKRLGISMDDARVASGPPEWWDAKDSLGYGSSNEELLDVEAMAQKHDLEPTTLCLEPHELERFSDHGLPDNRVEHVAECRYCSSLLAGLRAPEPLSDVITKAIRELVSQGASERRENESNWGLATDASDLGLRSLSLLPLLTMRLMREMDVSPRTCNPKAVASGLRNVLLEFLSNDEVGKAQRTICRGLTEVVLHSIHERPRIPEKEIAYCDDTLQFLEAEDPEGARTFRERYLPVRSASV